MAKSKEELISMIENDLVDPSTNKITGERVKNALTEMVDAMGTGGGQMEYWAIPPDAPEEAAEMMLFAFIIKGSYANGTVILPACYASIMGSALVPSGLAIDRKAGLLLPGDPGIRTLDELLDEFGVNFDDMGLVPIDKETFYTI